MNIDRNSLSECLAEIVARTLRPHNPVLVYSTSGKFTIQSELNPMNNDEHIISGQLDTSDGLDGFLGDLAADECEEFVAGMSDEYIAEYIIGEIE